MIIRGRRFLTAVAWGITLSRFVDLIICFNHVFLTAEGRNAEVILNCISLMYYGNNCGVPS